MVHALSALRDLEPAKRTKAALLSLWFFLTVATLWLLKPVRVASLLAHLGAAETPYVRLAAVAVVAVVVLIYSRVVNRLSRLQVARGASFLFAAVLVAFWLMIYFGGAALGAKRPFVWAVYILVEIYATVMVGIFWTYANDVVSSDEADRLYGVVGLGGIVGGIAGGAFVDLLAKPLGAINLLLVCAALVVGAGVVATISERTLHPPPRRGVHEETHGFGAAVEGAREVARSPYLRLLVGIVIAYEFTATLTDFVINVIFEHAYADEGQLAKMYGRLGWIASATAVVSQLFLVPRLLPRKRIALLVPPIVMAAAALGTAAFPLAVMAFALGASDRGLNYSLHQSVKETLYVPLTDAQKYKAKAFIDMFVDRAAKALAALVLIGVIARAGLSVRLSIAAALVAVGGWLYAARSLGKEFAAVKERATRGENERLSLPTSLSEAQ